MLNQRIVEKSSKDFRHDINALRALAVLGVVLYHYKVPLLNGGFAGVDIFFVISGYLMTKTIVNTIESGSFSLKSFYSRRINRILPALLFLVTAVLAISFFIYLPIGFRDLAKNALGSILFFSNLLYYKKDYFDASTETNVFLHTWSLSVEWQFYMLLPLLLLLISKFIDVSKKQFRLFFITITFLCFLVSMIAKNYWPSASFYLFPTRSWEMLVGGIAFLTEDFFKKNTPKETTYVAYLLLIFSLFWLSPTMEWPGFWTIIPVLGTFVIIVTNDKSIGIIKTQWIQFFGNISYSLYLWHWPLLVVASYLGFHDGIQTSTILIALSVAMAFFSTTYVESNKMLPTRSILIATFSISVLTACLTFFDTNDFLFRRDSIQISRYALDHSRELDIQFGTPDCFISSGTNNYNKSECLKIERDKKNYLLLGDSHSAHLSQSLRSNFDALNINMNQASSSGCMPLLNTVGQERCTDLIDYIYSKYLPTYASEIDGVIISANWIDGNIETLIPDIQKTIDYLVKLRIPIILIGQNETYLLPYATIAAREVNGNKNLSNKFINRKSREINSLLKSQFPKYYVDIYNTIMIKQISSLKVPYMFDENHFTKYGADLVSLRILTNANFKNFVNIKRKDLKTNRTFGSS
ncbi:acyltransferase family protein [Dyadobacter fanqingshengii]|uniref:Acyltransferase n=1 Tax=Dyadobacter fanqingshengii TaxID=2906443 RepID=A0A9X1PCN8_9BACT|nr:acyltransferase family protein [Dyadobacter fanqingshengii]MCF0042536.1 acyltransferase [Dyadobacter fanqingshengii]USJ36236.1 acyltransferase [Dyadobacter fanqingshengii]